MRRAKQRVFVIGFDGMDPTLARKWMDEGKLPNLKRLADDGTFATLGSTPAVGVAHGVVELRHRRQSRASTTSTTS